ncbi:MAG TPA: type II toxin-antitoxin system RelE/ParE family toxin [Sphingomonas sp.]
MQLSWLPEARSDLREIIGYIADRNPIAAERLNERIEHAAEHLTIAPHAHRPGRVDGTREVIVHPNYIVIYRVTEGMVWILSVLHARQQYP